MNKKFYCRQSKTDKNGEAWIELSLCSNKKRTYLPLDMKCRPEDFKNSMESKKDNTIKKYVEAVKSKVDDIIMVMTKRGIPITVENVVSYYKQGGVDKIWLMDALFEEYIGLKEGEYKTGKIIGKTYNRYKKCKEYFYKYCNLKGNENINTITMEHWKKFETGMLQKYEKSYVSGFQKKLKSVFWYAFETGKIPSFPFVNVKVPRVKKDIIYLTDEEIETVKKKEINIERLRRVRDLFIFQCFTGLSWTDMDQLTKDDFKQKDKIWYIKKKRQKTGQEFVIRLFPDALSIAVKYNFQLPRLSYQKYNQYVGELGRLCNIGKKFSTHIARRTCACFLVNHGVDFEIVANYLGDSVRQVRESYAFLTEDTILNDTNLQTLDNELFKKQMEELLGLK